jgi:beta-galactosidase
MAKTQRFLTFFTFLFAIISISAQIKIKELPSYDLLQVDSLFFDINQSREILSLRSNWEVYSPAAPERKAVVSIPSTFSGEESLVYERLFFVSRNQVNNKTLTLHFLGVDYTADVLLNDLVIYKHPGGIQPFDVKLPSDILKPNEENKLTVNINFELDDINTIPVLQRFLFPASRGGIISDVYLAISNKIFINKLEISPNVDANLETASIKIRSFIQNDQKKYVSIPEELSEYKLNYSLKTPSGEQKYSNSLENLLTNEISESTFEIKLNNPVLWSPNNPQYYVLEASITLNDSLIDLTAKRFSLYDISIEEDALKLNGNRFQINGTTYFYSENESGGLISYKKLQNDLKLIKETGFNTVRFAKVLPPLYALDICQSLGLFVLVELPLNSIPDEILTSNDFSSRVSNHLHLMIEKYSEYSSVLGFGLGGGYLGTSYDQYDFINSQAEIIKSNCDKLSYVSFVSLPASKINSLDLAGIELFSADENQLSDLASELNKIDYQVFISEATYPSFNGSSNGYLNQNSYEAAAKYYSDIIDFSSSNKLNGFVLNSFFDYRGDYKSFYAGYNEEYYYSIGLLPNAETIDRISYKVVKSKLTNTEKITIPIGSTKDDSPILFVIIGLILSLFMALLINSKRKFREDASRALIRPYNFFADIRDHRLLSGIQTIFLMFILAGSFALLIINLLYYLRTNLFLEKILLAFGSQNLIDAVIYLAWHPLDGFLILFAVSIIGIILLSMVIKIFSFFLKNKVFFSSIFYTTIWSFLPLSLLLPVELVLYRILAADIVNLYLYIVIALYLLWQVQRLFKGIHVIFDIKPSKVNLYGLVVIIIVIGGILLYYQLTNSTVYYLIRAVTEYKFL